MTIATFETIVPNLFAHEGGFISKNPSNFGISLNVLKGFRGNPKTNLQNLKELTKGEAVQIYKVQYWHAVKGDMLPAGLDYAMCDFALHSGSARAIRELQKILGVTVDGVLGYETISKIDEPLGLIVLLCKARLRYMSRLDDWPLYKTAWTLRVEEVRQLAVALYKKQSVDINATAVSPGKAVDTRASLIKGLLERDMIPQIVAAVTGLSGIAASEGELTRLVIAALFGVLTGVSIYTMLKTKKSAL